MALGLGLGVEPVVELAVGDTPNGTVAVPDGSTVGVMGPGVMLGVAVAVTDEPETDVAVALPPVAVVVDVGVRVGPAGPGVGVAVAPEAVAGVVATSAAGVVAPGRAVEVGLVTVVGVAIEV